MAADAGIVSTQAHTMSVAIPQRTALKRLMLPTPAMAPAITCVVETGKCSLVENRIDIAAALSAQKPLRGLRRVSRPPMVWTMRQPPDMVPRPIAALAERITQTGTRKVLAFMFPYYYDKYGYTPGGTFSIKLDDKGERLFVLWNGAFVEIDPTKNSDTFGQCSAMVINIPASERQE